MTKRSIHALVRLVSQQPWERTWIVVSARDLDEAVTVASSVENVAVVHEVTYDPAFIT